MESRIFLEKKARDSRREIDPYFALKSSHHNPAVIRMP